MSKQHECCCGGNKANQFSELNDVLDKYRDVKGALIPILQETQNRYGYLSKEVLEHIAVEIDVPISHKM